MMSFILVCRKVRRDYPNLWAHRRHDRKIMVAYWLPSCGLAPVSHRMLWSDFKTFLGY